MLGSGRGRRRSAVEGAALGVILMAAVVMSGAGAEFIYFQF
jgi:hypothetical protein